MTTKRPRGRMTAAQHEAWLKETGRWDALVENRRVADEARGALADEWRRAEMPLIEELRTAGVSLNSAWDLVNTSTPYPAALPILFRHLQRDYPDVVMEGIARALATPVARFGWSTLLDLFRTEVRKRAKDGLAVALAATADDSVIGDVIELATDAKHGASRLLLLRALERSKDPAALSALRRLAGDAEVAKEASVILKRLRAAED